MIAFLTKSDANEGFEQILDFLNASVIQYALMVNPTIYVSCIKQFWSSVSLKKTNDVMQLQALIDRRKVVIIEDTIRQALQLDDADSIDCLPNEEIFAELARMEYEKPSTNHVRNVDSPSKFYMYPRFLQLMINDQVGDLSSHTTKYTSPALTQKVFANIRRVGKGFSGVDTPLFDGMLVPKQVHADVVDAVADADADADADAEPTPPSLTPATTPLTQQALIPSSSQEVGKEEEVESFWVEEIEEDADEDVTLEEVVAEVAKDADVQGRLEESQAQVYHLDLKHAQKVLSMQDDKAEPAKLKEVIAVVTTAKLMTEVVTAAATTITAAPMTKFSVARRKKVEESKRLKRQAQIEHDEAYARELEAELNANINWNEVIEQVKRKEKQDNMVIRYQALKRKPQTEPHARKNMMVYLKNMAGYKMDFFKGMTYDEIRPIFEKHFNSIVAFLEKGEKELEEEASKQSKRKSETS
uniref:Xylulose kinase-1 n=1 Tax=Tanacetum cinerariifolium TaxID=118510 RepID=A0A6L2M2C3_TANCI|nr:hypothetical protein [Tanacetum cinerariifolium]